MKNSGKYIYTAIHIFAIVSSVCCDDEYFMDNQMDEDEILDPHSIYFDRKMKERNVQLKEGDMIDPHSLYFDRKNKRINIESDFQLTDKSTQKYSECGEQYHCVKNVESYRLQEIIFYKRLVNMILSNISIQRQSDDLIVGTLDIEMSHSQMETLRNFQIGEKPLREIDAILSNVIKEPKFNYMFVFTRFYDGLIRIYDALKTMAEYPQTIIVVLSLIVSYVALRRIHWQRGVPIFFVMQLIMIMSFFMTWWQLIQEAEIKFTATQMKYSEIPIACQPDKMNMWHKLISYISPTDDCEKYYEAMMSNPKLQVTPAVALSHFISTAVLHPLENLGTALSSFIRNATHDLPWIYAWVVKLVLYLCIGIGIIMLPFTLFGASIKLALGPLFNFGINCQEKNRKGNLIQDTPKREPIQIILQQCPRIADTPATRNVLKADERKAIQPASNTHHEGEIFDTEDNFQECTDDWAFGDTVTYMSIKTNNTKSSDSEQCDLINTKTEDGSGDR